MEPQHRKRDRLRITLAAIKDDVAGLEQVRSRLANVGPLAEDSLVKATVKEAIALIFQTKLEKLRLSSFELMSHLETQSREHKNSTEHYQAIMQNIIALNNRIAALNPASSLATLDQDLAAVAKETVPLTRQPPYTLLMMRVVEIGLPILLSMVSLSFLLRYSLTEKRSHEIKDLVEKETRARSEAASDVTGVVTVSRAP